MRIFTKRLLAVLLSVIMVIMVVPVSSITVSAENTTEFLGGEGTEEKPYLISNKTHLNNVRYHLYAHFKMVADIVFTEADFAEGGEFYNNGQGWEPIGTFQSPFFGTFDGNQHSITGLYCNQRGSSYMYVGFFGYNTGHIQNFGMVDAYVYAQTTSPSDSVCVGGISGYNNGMIVNCYNTGSIFSNSFNDYAYAGGIAGYNNKTVINCYNTGVISSTSAFTYGGGGITGINYGMISSCYNTGNVTGEVISVCTGGIAGKNLGTGTINNCYNIGKISAMSSTDATNGLCNAGGITGVNASKSIVNNCYNVGDAFASATGTKYARPYAGGISGDNDGIIQNCYYWGTNDHGVGSGIDVAVKCTFEQMKQSSTFLEYNFDTIWKFTNEDIYPFPVLQGVPHIKGINIDPYIGFFDGIGTKEDPYLISTKAHLNNVRNHLDAHFKMVADIVFTEADFAEGGEFYNDGQGWEPIGGNGSTTFTGVFDGDEHTITGLYCNRSGNGAQYAGLFGNNKGVIHNIGIVNGIISVDVNSRGSMPCAGGVVGINNGTIYNCYNKESIVISSGQDEYSSGNCGGIVGRNEIYGIVDSCYNIGNVTSDYGGGNAGGITGSNCGKINNCYNAGSIKGKNDVAGGIAGANWSYVPTTPGEISNCYNIGNVSALSIAGSIVGNNSGTISDCYYLDNVSKGVGNGTDPTTKCTIQQMNQQSTFAGFDFDTVWEFLEKNLYPFPTLQTAPYFEENTEENTTDFAGGTGTPYNPFLISNKTHLNNVRKYLDAHFKMVADIVFTEADFAEGGEFYNDGQGWEPIGGNGSTTFTGVFDGDEHTITGLYCNRSGDGVQCAGLFGYNKGIIHNLGIEDGDISSKTLSSDTSSYAGGIAGYNDNNGTINDCYNTGSTSASSDYYAYAGGIAGYNDNDGTISNCYNIGSVSASSNAGGILGNNSGTISNCYNVGDVSKSYDAGGIAGSNSGTISNCYNIGDVSKSYYVGGIAGRNYKTITNCYYLDNILKGVGNGTDTTIKCTVEQMKQHSTFVGFDFDYVWEIDSYRDYHYPQLKNNRQEPIQSIELLSQSADIQVIEGLWPDSIDATVKITYADGLEITTDVTSQMLSELDISQIGTQTIHLIYGGKVTAETIDVEVIPKSISSIAVTTLPDKTAYVQGQPLNPAGGELTVSYNNNTSEIVDLSEAQLSYPLEQTGIVTATAEYKGFSATFSVTINEKQIQSIGIIEPEKLSYIEGETLDLTGGKLQITYVSEDNYTERIPLTLDMISGYDPNVIGIQTLTVEYEGQKITFVIRVTAKSLTHIAVTARPDKISYLEDKDAFDPTGGQVTLYYNNGTGEIIDLSAEMVSGFDNTQVGKQALTVTYEGFTDTFEVEITAKKLSAIKLTTLPTKLAYTKNYEAFDPTGGQVTLYYNNDTSEVIDLSVEMVSGFDNTQVGKQTLIVIYEGFNDTFEIEILAYLPGDTDGDSKVTIDDVAYLLNHVYFPELYPVSQECDFNGDDTVNIDDVAYLLNHVYFPDIYPLE